MKRLLGISYQLYLLWGSSSECLCACKALQQLQRCPAAQTALLLLEEPVAAGAAQDVPAAITGATECCWHGRWPVMFLPLLENSVDAVGMGGSL